MIKDFTGPGRSLMKGGEDRVLKRPLIIAVILTMLISAVALAWNAPKYDKIYPYLKNVPGWKAEKPVGQTMSLNGHTFSMVMKRYKKGTKEATVVVGFGLFGPPAAYISQLGGLPSKFYQETDEVIIKTTTYRGYRTFVQIFKKENRGFIGVVLSGGSDPSQIAYVALNFENMSLGEAKAFLNNFDLKGIRSLIH